MSIRYCPWPPWFGSCRLGGWRFLFLGPWVVSWEIRLRRASCVAGKHDGHTSRDGDGTGSDVVLRDD